MGRYNLFNPDPYSVHIKIVNSIGDGKTVLDVGCADGYISQKLVKNGNEVVGIELDQESANKAQRHCKEIFNENVEDIELPSDYVKYFDFIIFADVLEHLKYPDIVLKNFLKYLKDDGQVIVSVPNVANWRIRIKLLRGNFDYKNYGILDKGHLRFFTKNYVKDLFLDSGLDISEIYITVGDVPLFPSFFHSIGTLWPNLLAYQFLVIGKKR